jgi:hypothetical protein
MAYSTPAHSLIFNSFFAISHDTVGHLVASLSQSQSTLAAKRKDATNTDKDNSAKRGGASWIPRMMPNVTTKRLFFLSPMWLLEGSSGSRGGWLRLIQLQ